MIILKEAANLTHTINRYKANQKTIGFVPTMGALHNGHISLITKAAQENDIVVASIFVNPTQFNNSKDFEKYPITIEKDIELLHQAGCSILFLPSVAEIYPNGVNHLKHYDLGYIETVYDGAFRPGHFQGVCNVVEILFRITEPHRAYFGLKDYQQCMVINKLVSIMQWNEKLELHFCETLREADGLAMSSRNMRLNEDERAIAPTIYQMLTFIKQSITIGDTKAILDTASKMLTDKGFKPDYIDLADAYTLEPVHHWDGKQDLVCLVAAFLNEVRLIDNMLITTK